MVDFPNCKINIGLYINGKRPDGFHDLQTIFYPVLFNDIIEIIVAEKTDFSHSGYIIDGPDNNNLCYKAYELLKKDFSLIPSIKIHLHKNIPVGAGLGGGSSDGAFMLKLLNNKFSLGLSAQQLISYALQLGSDCPFFIIDRPCYATGRGDILKEITLDLSAYDLLIVNPGIHINTGWAFSQTDLIKRNTDLIQNIAMPVKEWKENIFNDFEPVIFGSYPLIKELKGAMYANGALYAAMSGTGSSVYGIFEKSIKNASIEINRNYFSRWL